ncbi:MAG: hypothetical protein KJZ86_27615 [Caldilineaceae bacterium]|nr:hypothetical protein [Caldilineaceae bacterium]
MDIRSAAAQLETGIRAAFTAEKLGCHIVRTVRGPHTLTTGIRLYEPDVKSLARVGRMAQAIEARSGVSPIRIHSQAGLVYVEAPSPQPIVVPGAVLSGQGLAIPLGLTPLRAVAGLDFDRDSHLLLVAPTNGGKTTAAKAVALAIARQHSPKQARFVVSTFKPADWLGLAHTAHCGGMITDVDETAQMIAWLVGIMYKRTSQMQTTPRLFVFLDDLLNLLKRRPDLADPLAEVASLGRGAGIHLIIGTQRVSKSGMGDAAVSGNITARLVFRTASAQDAAAFTGRGDTGAESIGAHAGDAILVTSAADVQRIAVAYVSDADLAALPQGGGSRPWLAAGTPTGTEAGIPAEKGQNGRSEGGSTGIPASVLPLAYRPPTPAEEMALAGLYARKGSKNKTLAAAYAEGKTPKTLGWLNGALEKMGVNV